MAGTIDVQSAPDKGTTFTVTLPLKEADKSALIQEKQLVEPPDLSDKRILIVEDNKVNQVVCEAMLAPTQATTEIVENGQECLDRLKEASFDLILMDIQMPVMDGETACKEIRKDGKAQRIIALTANVMQSDRERYSAIGFDGCIAKPIETCVLYGALSDALCS